MYGRKCLLGLLFEVIQHMFGQLIKNSVLLV